MNARRAIVVLGPHRSGTSVVTRALRGAGADLGKHLLEPNDDNPKGFFENAKIVAFNDRLLKHLGMCWDHLGAMPASVLDDPAEENWLAEAAALLREEFEDNTCIGLKDPRLCLLGAFWNKALWRSGYTTAWVLVLRHPVESARSQQSRVQRDRDFHFVGGELAEGILLWARYMLEALRFLRDQAFVLASHDHFLQQPREAFIELSQALGLNTASAAAVEFGAAFIDPALARHRRASGDTELAEARAYADIHDALAARSGVAPLHGNDCASILDALSERLGRDPELAPALQRAFVRARHAAVEAGLELAEAKRIVAFQEHALKQSEQRASELEQHMLSAQKQFASEREKAERLALANASLRDRLGSQNGRE